MGGPMAANLARANAGLVVFDTRSEAVAELVKEGAEAAHSLADMANRCSTIGICVWSDAQLEEIIFGVEGLLVARAGPTTLIIHSTISPARISDIADRCAKEGWQAIDAPISGGRAGAINGTLTLMVGGSKELFDLHQPYFKVIGEHIFHVGLMPGSGEVAKLCNNLMGLCNAYGIVEAMKLGAAYGVDEAMIRDTAMVSTGNSWYLENYGFFDNLIETHPHLSVLYKDLWEAVHAAQAKDLHLVISGSVALSAPALLAERREHLRARNKDAV